MNKKLFGTALLGLLLSAATGTFVSCKDYDDDIENLQNQIDQLRSLQSSVDALKSDLAGVQSTCQANLTSAIADLKNGDVKKAIDAAAAAQATASEAAATAAQAVAAATTAQGSADAAAAAAAAAQTAADAANALAEAAKAAAEGISLEEQDAKALAEIATLAEKLAGVEGAMLKAADVEKMIADAQLAGSAVDAETLAKINAALEALNEAAASIVGKRLTSLVFAPTTYINGIEAINFVNLYFDDWGLDPKNWLNDNAVRYRGYDNHMIADYGVQAKYLVSPTGVTLDGIKSLSYRPNDATNTRAMAKDVTLSIVESSLEDGVLTLDLKKEIAPRTGSLPQIKKLENMLEDLKVIAQGGSRVTIKTSYGGADVYAYVNGEVVGRYQLYDTDKGLDKNDKTFSAALEAFLNTTLNGSAEATVGYGQIEVALKNIRMELNAQEQLIIAALEAKLAESVLDENEKGNEISVFSDWARVQEENAYPKIHNAKYVKNGLAIDSYSGSHFWYFHNIYADGTNYWSDHRSQASIDANKKGIEAEYVNELANSISYVACEAVYSDTLDLNKLVEVCINNGSTLIKKEDYDKYGLKFEFHLMDYKVKNEYLTKDGTNQADFAKLDEATGILTPTSENGVEFNADAIGRTPVIQAVLRYTKKTADEADDEVIDVRYFKVKWCAENPSTQLSTVDFTTLFGFECLMYEDGWILEKDMNLFYTGLNDGKGIGKDQFRKAFKYIGRGTYGTTASTGYIFRLPEGFELTKDNLEEFVASYDFSLSKNRIGEATWKYDNYASTQTQNIVLSYYADKVNPRVDLDWCGDPYSPNSSNRKFADENDFTVKGFFYFESEDGTQRVYVPTTLNVKKNSYYSNYQQTQWNTEAGAVYEEQPKSLEEPNKFRNVNPQLMSSAEFGTAAGFKSVQILGSVTYGYMYVDDDKKGKNPVDIAHLAKMKWYPGSIQADKQGKNVDPFVDTYITFDQSRLGELKGCTDKDHSKYVWFEHERKLYYGIPLKDGMNNIIGLEKGSMGAVIDDDTNNIYLVDNRVARSTTEGLEVNYVSNVGVPTEAARLLVGQQVPVIVTAHQCYSYQVIDQYKFNFLKPLLFTPADNPVELVDIKMNGDTQELNVASVLKLVENYGQLNSEIVLYDSALTGDAKKNNDALKAWYGVKLLGVNNEQVLTNLNTDGTKDDLFDTLLSDIQDKDGNPLYEVIFDNIIENLGGAQKIEAYEKQADGTLVKGTYLVKYDDKTNASLFTDVELYDKDGNRIQVDELNNGKVVYTGTQSTEEKVIVKDQPKVKVYLWSSKSAEKGYTYTYDLNKVFNAFASVPADKKVDTSKEGYKPNAWPCFEHTDNKYYTLPNGAGEEVSAYVITVDVEARVALKADNSEVNAYNVNGTWYTHVNPAQNGTLQVVDADKAVENSGKYYLKKADGTASTTEVYVFKKQATGDLDADGFPVIDYVKATTGLEVKYNMTEWMEPQQDAKKVDVSGKVYVAEDYQEETTNGLGTVKFHNMSGNAIAKGDSFEVKIPVVVDTKWEKNLTGHIHVIVKSGIK